MLAIYIYISLLYYVPTRWGQLVLEGGNARLLILRAWTTVPRPLLLGYTFQSLTRYKGDRFRSWLRPSVPISKGLYTHRGNRPHISADETGLARCDSRLKSTKLASGTQRDNRERRLRAISSTTGAPMATRGAVNSAQLTPPAPTIADDGVLDGLWNRNSQDISSELQGNAW